MKGLWCVIGKASLDPDFTKDLENIVSGSFFDRRMDGKQTKLDENLSDFLFYEHGFFLSRWERSEVVRLVKDEFGAIDAIHKGKGDLKPPNSASENFFAFVGLCCIDSKHRKNVEKMTKSYSRDLSVILNAFRLSDSEIRWLRALFKKSIFSGLKGAHDAFWTRPGLAGPTSCIWSFTHDPDYKHLPPEKLNKLLVENDAGGGPIQQESSGGPF